MKKPSVRERIIETASRLFYVEGYNQTGINQIIEEANVAKASMYQHFRSKEDIAATYLHLKDLKWINNLLLFISNKKNTKSKLLASFDYLIEWMNESEFRGCGFQNIIADLPKDQNKITDQVIFHKNKLRSLIHDLLINDGSYSNKKAKQIGDEILILLEGAIILSQIQKNDWPIHAAKNACTKLLN